MCVYVCVCVYYRHYKVRFWNIKYIYIFLFQNPTLSVMSVSFKEQILCMCIRDLAIDT